MEITKWCWAEWELVSFHKGSSDWFQTWCVRGRGVPLHGWKSRIWISWCFEKLQPYKRRCTTGGNFKYKTIWKKWFLIQLQTVFAGSVREIPARVCWTAVSLMNPMMCALWWYQAASASHIKKAWDVVHRAKGALLSSQTPPFNFHTDVWAVSVFVIILTYNL